MYSKCTSTSDNVANVIFFADIVNQQVTLWVLMLFCLFLHWRNQLYELQGNIIISSMNQQTLECRKCHNPDIYKKYEPNEYFGQYIRQGCRMDGRKFHQFRKIKFQVNNNTVMISQGGNIAVSEYSIKTQLVPYQNTINVTDKLKISVKLPSSNTSQAKRQRYLQKYLTDKLNLHSISASCFELFCDKKTGKNYLQKGEIRLRVISQNGSLQQNLLLLCSMQLWTARVPKIQSRSTEKKTEFTFLPLSQFLYPNKFADILGQIFMDPTSQQTKKAKFEVTFIHNILAKLQLQINSPEVVCNFGFEQQQNMIQLKNLQKVSKQCIHKIALDLEGIRKQVLKEKTVKIQIQDKI